MRENRGGPNRWQTDRSEAGALPDLGDGPGSSRAAYEELRKYPFFFADEDDEAPDPPPALAAQAERELSATAPPLPAPPTEIRPLLTRAPETTAQHEVQRKAPEATPEAPAPASPPMAASLAERHAAAIARQQHAAPAAPRPSAAPVAPAAGSAAGAPTAHVPQAFVPVSGPWHQHLPAGISLVAVILYFLIGGVALLATGLVLGGLGGTLIALFGLVVTAVAAFVAWQELTTDPRR